MSLAALAVVCSLASVTPKLHAGVNVTRWFCYQQDYTADHCRSYLLPQDFQNFKALKLDFVRLCVAPEFIYDHGKVQADRLALLDEGLAKLFNAGLTVLLDLHDNGQLALDKPGTDTSEFVAFWHSLAKHYSGKHESNLIFEPLNEPQFPNLEEKWWILQDLAIGSIRKADPARTVVATGIDWGGIDSLVRHKPVAAKNVIYSVHCYDPFFFSHEGATWAGEDVKHFREMPFPSSPESVAKMIDKIEPSYQDKVKWYGDQRYGGEYLERRVKLATDWGRLNGVPVFLGEFGAYPPVAEPASRERWFQLMKTALDKYKLPWCMWGYDDGFCLGREIQDGKIVLDPLVKRVFFGL